MRLFKRRPIGNPDPIAFMERVGQANFGENYTDTDLYRDFRKVFLGSPEGLRVLNRLFMLTHMAEPHFDPDDPNQNSILIKAGAHAVGIAIMATMNADPTDFSQE